MPIFTGMLIGRSSRPARGSRAALDRAHLEAIAEAARRAGVDAAVYA